MRLPNLKFLHKEIGINILIVGYRGYGHSEGIPSENGLEADGEAILKFALDHPLIDNHSMFLFGRSLGGAVSIQLAAKSDLFCGMILENTFTCISEMVDQIFPILK
jgi:pimeloyl-ACP methyl ester carboxylesterase